MFKHLILFASLATPLSQALAADPLAIAADKLAKLERDFGGSIGVYAIDTGSGATVANRPNERFPMCSSFKGFLAAGCWRKAKQNPACWTNASATAKRLCLIGPRSQPNTRQTA